MNSANIALGSGSKHSVDTCVQADVFLQQERCCKLLLLPQQHCKPPMLINCVAYQEGKKLTDVPVVDISEYLKEPDTFVWVALRDPDVDEIAVMQDEFSLHEL